MSQINKYLARFHLDARSAPDADTPIWMTVYSDMITNLMLFFLLMFALNLLGEKHLEEAAVSFKSAIHGKTPTEAVNAAVPSQNLDEFIRTLSVARKDLQVIQESEGVRLRLAEPVLFDPGKADLKDAAGQVLSEIAKGLRKLPHLLVVEGHTDNVPLAGGIYRSNWELSEARAENVVNYLFEKEGIPQERLAVAGYGEYWPFADNDSALNRALNRRIELLLILDEKKPL